jgi:hypothetical protein
MLAYRLVEIVLHIIEDFFFIVLELFIAHRDARGEWYENKQIVLTLRCDIGI